MDKNRKMKKSNIVVQNSSVNDPPNAVSTSAISSEPASDASEGESPPPKKSISEKQSTHLGRARKMKKAKKKTTKKENTSRSLRMSQMHMKRKLNNSTNHLSDLEDNQANDTVVNSDLNAAHITNDVVEHEQNIATFPSIQSEEFIYINERQPISELEKTPFLSPTLRKTTPIPSPAFSNTLSSPAIPKTPLTSPALPESPLQGSQMYKQLKNVRQNVAVTLPEYEVVKKPGRIWTVEVAAKWKVENNITDKAYEDMKGHGAPSLSTVRRFLDKIAKNLEEVRKQGLAKYIIDYINSLPDYPDRPDARVGIGIDAGGGYSKITVSLPDIPRDPLSPFKQRIYISYKGSDNRDQLKNYSTEINDAVKLLQEDLIETNHGLKQFVCFFIADCKCGDSTAGLQGGSATRPCPKCTIPSSQWQKIKSIPESSLRKIEDIQTAGLIIEAAEEDEDIGDKQLIKLKKDNNSVMGVPLMPEIPLSRYSPDALHINCSGVNSTIKHCPREKAPELHAEIDKLKVTPNPGRKDYAGGECRKILQHFDENTETDGYGIDLLRAFAKIEKYAEARDLEEYEIDALEQAIKECFELIDAKYPGLDGKKTKLHLLKFHVVPFVREHKSWGKFSTQGLESTHRQKNLSDRKIPGKSEAAQERQNKYFQKTHYGNRNTISGIKMISVSFEQLMIKQKNILCVCSSVINLALFFKDKKTCKKVFNGIQRKMTQSCELLKDEILDIFYQKFLIPIFKSTKTNLGLQVAVKFFLSLFKPAQIKEITKLLKEKEIDCLSFFNELLPRCHASCIVETDNSNVNENVSKRNLRKRKYVDYQRFASSYDDKSDDVSARSKMSTKTVPCKKVKPPNVSNISNTIIKKPYFKIEQYKKDGMCFKNVIVYVSLDSKLCYNYNCKNRNNRFGCRGCAKSKKYVYARLIVDKDGEECVELFSTQHVCKPQEEEKILSSTEFELQNNGKKLLIFASKEDRSMCYEYFAWINNRYICRGCDKLNFGHYYARIFDDGPDGKSYVKVYHGKHVCQPIKYDPKEKETIVKLPNFKVEKFNDKIQCMVIYDPNNKNLCYNYIFSSPRGNIFECYRCRYDKVNVIARLRHDKEGEPYVELNLQNHICEPHPEETILRNILVQCNERKVVIPLAEDPKLCNEYVLMKNNTYRCRECCRVQFHSNIWLFGNANDGYYAKIVDKKHACKPIRFQEKEKRTIIKKPYYKIEKFYKNGIENKSLVVYDLENPKLCFNYSWMNSKKHFRCSKCHNLNAFVTANIRKSKTDGGEFIELGLKEHVCKLLPEERILLPSQFHVPSNGKKDPSDLFVYEVQNKDLWYAFVLSKGNIYRCRKCYMKNGSCQVKLFQNEKNEYYVKIDEGKLFCKPTKVSKLLLKN